MAAEDHEPVSENLSAEELRNCKGILIRDYNQKMRDTGQKKEELVRTLNKIVRMESFQDDFTGNRWNRCWSFPMMQCVF